MKKNRIISSLLCLSLAAGLLIPGLPAYAEGEGESGSNSGMKLSKTAKYNESDDTYTITLEAYATGQKVISQVNKDVPTDIVLVLDQSSSMADPIGEAYFDQYKDVTGWLGTTYHTRNKDYYEMRHNGGNENLWHKLDDDSYVSVSVKLKHDSYTEITNGRNNSTYDGAINYWNNQNNLYAKVNGEYQKVTVSRTSWDGTYTYSLSDSNNSNKVIGSANRASGKPTFTGIDGGVLYLASVDDSKTVYTYTYVDADGNTQTIGTSTGANARFEPPFYERKIDTKAGGSRIKALTTAVTTFADSVATKAKGTDGIPGTEDDIDHRIAVVGFACSNTGSSGYNNYQNTEVFIGSNQYKYGNTARGQYANALQSMKTTQGQNNIKASIGALTADGATYVNHGVEMANGILNANPVQAGEQRNRVVVVFTDGVPGYSGYESGVATSAIDQANATRALGATVYAVGIFSGADASSAGDSDGNDTQKANWFMQNLSNNKGNPRTPSYYLSAADAGTLNSIFQQIADNIQTGGSSTTLDDNAVIRDIIAPQFELPANATTESIKLYTAESNGSVNSWKTRETFAGSVSLGANDNSVSVSGFSFKDNWCGNQTINGQETFHDGKKLIIEFTVQPKDGFLGGNNVYTNTSAGVYENAEAKTPVLEFNRPQVNVPIEDVIVTPQDKNVYLLNGVTLDELKDGAIVKVGDVSLDLSKENYGLQDWQNQYVDIIVKITDANGNEVTTSLPDLKDDTTYTVEVTVKPKSDGKGADGEVATKQSRNGTGKINVYKPELTYKDSEVFYGGDVPTDADLAANLKETVWKHGDTVANADMGPAPTLTFTYEPDSTMIANGKINSKEDIGVAATVKIGDTDVTDYTIFAHEDCNPACGWSEPVQNGNPAFLLHVKTASLTINKTGVQPIDHNGSTENQSNIFTVTGEDPAGNPITITLAITGNGYATVKDLPLGSFTVTENGDWCWRYTTEGPKTVPVTKDGASVTFTNIRKNPYWLSGDNVNENQFTINVNQG